MTNINITEHAATQADFHRKHLLQCASGSSGHVKSPVMHFEYVFIQTGPVTNCLQDLDVLAS